MKDYTKRDIERNLIIEQLSDLSLDTLIEIYSEITSEYFWNDLEQLIEDNNIDGYNAITSYIFGDCKGINEDYYTFDGYNNIKSYSSGELEEELIDYLKTDYIDNLIDDYEQEFDLTELEELEEELDELTEKEESYLKFKEEQKKELDDFISKYVIFAFSDKQLKEQSEKKNFDINNLVSFGRGILCLKEQSDNFINLTNRQAEELKNELENNTDFLQGALFYELQNHEFGYTRDTFDTFDCLGITNELYQKNEQAIEQVKQTLIKFDNMIN